MIKVTQTMRYEIAFDKTLYKLLDDISYAIWRVKNKATTMAYDWQHFSFGYNERFGEFPKDTDLLGVGLTSDVYRNVKSLATNVASVIVDAASQEAVKKLLEMRSDILKGNKSVPNYRRDGSFPMKAQGIKELERISSSKYTVKLSLLSKEGAKEYGTSTQQTVTLKTGGNAKAILDRIISGEYKMCDSRIVRKKNKWYLALAYQFEKAATKLAKSNVMGIDLGVVNAATLAFNNEPSRYYIGGSEILEFRRRIEKRRNQLLRQAKYCGEGRIGHGRATRIKPIEKLRDRVENFKRTTNHRYAKFIVEKAIKHGCGVIQMEDLSGITEKADRFLKMWPYYDLQKKIEYKAKAVGIEVRKVKPKYTSQRCSCCGHIAEDNRPKVPDQSKFKCVVCGYKTNADYNAARNIALPDIEKRIEMELKRKRLLAKEKI